MTSKISFSKLLKQDLKRSGGIIAVIGLMFFLAFTVAGIVKLDEMLSYVKDSSSTIQEVINYFKEYVSFNNAVAVITVLSAVLCGVTRYSYLHSEVKLDLFHSMPVKREKLYWVQYVSGVVQYAVPMIINLLLIIIIGSIRGVVAPNILTHLLIGLFVNLLFFLIIYSTTILAMVMTGKVVVGILGVCTFLSYFFCVYFLGMALFSIFFKTFYNSGGRWAASFNTYLSPVTLYSSIIEKARAGEMFLLELAIGLIMLVLITAASLFLYKLRYSEAAGRAMAFPKTEAAVKFLLVVPISLFAGIAANSMSVQNKDIWLVLGIVFGVIVTSAVIEFIYNMDFSRILDRKKLLLASLVTALCIIGIFRLDILKYDSNIPDKSEVDTAAVVIEGLYYDAYQMDDQSRWYVNQTVDEYVLDVMKVSDLDSVYRIIDSAVMDQTEQSTNGVIIKFRMKNGKEKLRRYSVETKALYQELTNLYEDQSFKESINPIMNMVGDEISQIDLCFLDESQQMELSRKQITALTDTFREELETMKYEDLKEPSLLRLHFESARKDGISGTYTVYPHFKETLSLLKEYGYQSQLTLDPAQINTVNLTYYDGENAQEKSFSDKAAIKEIAVNMIPNYSNNYFIYWSEVDYSVSVNYLNEKGDVKSGQMYYAKDRVPEYVKKLFNE